VRTGLEAKRQVIEILDDNKTIIIRETLRFFDFKQKGGAEAALSSPLSTYPIKTYENKSSVTEQPLALLDTLKQIVPFAKEVLDLEKQIKEQSGKEAKGLTGKGFYGSNFVKDEQIQSNLVLKRAALSQEIGSHIHNFPILSQIEVDEISTASEAGAEKLGNIVFSTLKRAYSANKKMRSKANKFKDVGENMSIARLPEKALTDFIHGIGHGKTVWSYPKFVERAISRVVGFGDDVALKALNNISVVVNQSSGSVAKEVAQGAGEMMVTEAASRFSTKFVPVVNIVLSVWHISILVQEFKDQHDEFYCSLDPRDTLVEAAPSVAGLVANIAFEASFVFI
jgi:hypothetical protein